MLTDIDSQEARLRGSHARAASSSYPKRVARTGRPDGPPPDTVSRAIRESDQAQSEQYVLTLTLLQDR